MQITISLQTLAAFFFFFATSLAGTGYLVYISLRGYQARKKVQQNWVHLGPYGRMQNREQRFFTAPHQKHLELHGKDIHCHFQALMSEDGIGVDLYHAEGLDDLGKWSEGKGLALAKTIAIGVLKMEAARPGIVSLLPVLIDELYAARMPSNSHPT